MWSIHIWLGLGWLASNGGGRFWLSGGLWCGLLTMDRPSVEQKTQLAQKCNEWAELVIWNINRVKQRIFVNHNLTEPGGNTYYMVMSRPAATKNSLCFSCYDKWSVRDVYTVEKVGNNCYLPRLIDSAIVNVTGHICAFTCFDKVKGQEKDLCTLSTSLCN